MPELEGLSQSQQQSVSGRGHTLPRRTSPEASVTLQHHKLARDASLRASAGSRRANNTTSTSNETSSPRRNSSDESHQTGQSDPKKWFDQSNQNPTATFDGNNMEADPPFFQKETDSSNEDSRPYHFQTQYTQPALPHAHSSSADDYRSVIDDLTVEIQKLKEELKRYKQKGPHTLRKDKLFEIKIHGLSKRKRRELETTLRDFASSLDGSPQTSSSQEKKGKNKKQDIYGFESGSKHASSSSGSNTRPVDSAYASMSTGNQSGSGATSFGGRPSMSSRGGSGSSDQKVENYLRDIPEGLYPRHMVMTEKDKKKYVVRRLEQIFTGKITGRGLRRNIPPPSLSKENSALGPTSVDNQAQPNSVKTQSSTLALPEAAREARILGPNEHPSHSRKKNRSRDNGSGSNSNADNADSRENGSSSADTNASPLQPPPPEQRPTRPKDLDPDRVQVPSENMDYIRHLGLVPPELLKDASNNEQDVQPDAEGWVYLNLLINLAQLHMINVTPGFVRKAVSEMSTKFQLSPDGRKIRWRGGTQGTRFASESSGENSQYSRGENDTDADGPSPEARRKRQKTGRSVGEEQSGGSSHNASKSGPLVSAPSESFHYKPLFLQKNSSGDFSPDETLSSFGPVEDSNVGESGWGRSGSGGSNRRKRRRDGAIIYYNGANFCTDLSGDPVEALMTTYGTSSGLTGDASNLPRPAPIRSNSGSSLDYRPLRDHGGALTEANKMNLDNVGDVDMDTDASDSTKDLTFETPWSAAQQFIEVQPLEPCGIGGTRPEDHFMVVVTTSRPKLENSEPLTPGWQQVGMDQATDSIALRLASMTTSSPGSHVISNVAGQDRKIEIEYISGRIKRLAPVALPPPAIFFPAFSSNDSFLSDDDDIDMMSSDPLHDDEEVTDNEIDRGVLMQMQTGGYPDDVDLSSGDEDGEDPDNEPDAGQMYDVGDDEIERQIASRNGVPLRRKESSKSDTANRILRGAEGSSAATAGGIESDFPSSNDMSEDEIDKE